MDPYRWEEIQSTFNTLVELDDVERGNRLTALSDSDPQLRVAVESLLAADSEVEARLAELEDVFFPQSVPPSDRLGLAGRTISHFEIGEPIGSGGMGVVYRAEDVRLGRAVALKFLLPSYGPAAGAEARFLREARLVAALDHPNLCAIHEVGMSDDGRPFLAMALYAGEDLKARMTRDGPMPVSEVIAITRQIAEGLEYAHGAGIVHRDLKPGNVMLLPDGTVKILDFGLAKARDQSLSEPGARFGTVSYMAPEQIRGEVADARADLWALGVVVYQMLAGRKPFDGEEDIAIAHAILHDAPAPLTMHRSDVSAALEDLVFRLLEKDSARRYATASELVSELAALDTAAQGTMSSLRTRWRRARRTMSSRRAPIMTAFGAVVGASGLFAWSAAYRDPFSVATRALEGFDLGRAEVEFARAAKQKPDNASARLWLAQTMMLNGRPATDWKPSISFAADRRRQLAPTEQKRLDALTAFSTEVFPSACERFAEVAEAERRTKPDSYHATVALADCLRDDQAVIPAVGSASGYKFRTSYHRVESLYQQALEQNSTAPAAYAVLLPRLQRILPIDKGKFRRGFGTGSIKGPFLSLPALAGDTIAYVPYLFSAAGDWRTRDPNALDAALARNRSRLREWSLAWAKVSPRDPDAHAFLGRILEATGELVGGQHAAMDQIRLARSLARGTPSTSVPTFLRDLRLGTGEVRLWLRLGRFDKAATLADSLLLDLRVPAELDEKTQSEIAETLSTIAALRGRFQAVLGLQKRFAAEYRVRLESGEFLTLPPALGADALTLVAYASFGVEPDSIATIADRITQNTKSLIAPAKAASVRTAILTRPFALAAPVIGPGPLASLGSIGDIRVRAIRFLANNDRASARRLADSIAARHSEYAPGEITMDAVYQDAWLRAAVGDSAGAASLLDNALRGLSVALPSILSDPIEAACLVRATILRAQLAASMRRPAIARARAAEAYQLWGRGDPVISASLGRIAELR
jgi:serine/threonine protein kinase